MQFHRFLLIVSGLAAVVPATRASTIFDNNTNGSFATALNLDPGFSQEFVADITDSTLKPHVTAYRYQGLDPAVGEWYSFSALIGSSILFDIDSTRSNLYLRIFNPDHIQIAANNDGDINDPGSGTSWDWMPYSTINADPFLAHTALYTGLYYVEVSAYIHNPIYWGVAYKLHISVGEPVATPDSGSTLALLGSAIVGLAVLCRLRT